MSVNLPWAIPGFPIRRGLEVIQSKQTQGVNPGFVMSHEYMMEVHI